MCARPRRADTGPLFKDKPGVLDLSSGGLSLNRNAVPETNGVMQLLTVPIANAVGGLGKYAIFCRETVMRSFNPRPASILIIRQMEFVGNKSLGIIVMAGAMVGAVFGLHLGNIFGMFRAESMLGAAAGFALSKELAPVVGAFLVTGRAGSAMAAEIATMRVNEQIDAMRVMSVNPYNYLVAPRMIASMIMMPLLAGIFILSGISAAFFVGSLIYHVDQGIFFEKIAAMVKVRHLMEGMQKALVFGFIFSSAGCYKGLNAGRGASGVGRATTEAVVLALVAILVMDFVISYLQFKILGK